jgi:hypothetical protein
VKTYATRLTFIDRDHNQAVVQVQTHQCFYQVAIHGEEVTLCGPGLEQQVEDVPLGLSYEGTALCAVLMLEEKE